jgi:hypothetical protein
MTEKLTVESFHVEERGDKGRAEKLRLDPHGLPLSPQPSNFQDDPLVRIPSAIYPTGHPLNIPKNWPRWMKWGVLLQVSFMAFLGPFNAAVPNPSLALLSAFFHHPVEIVAYSTIISIITGGVAVGDEYFCCLETLVVI